MTFTLPFPIPLRAAYKFSRFGGYKSNEYKGYEALSHIQLKTQGVVLADQPYSVEIYLYSDIWVTKGTKKSPGKIAKKDLDNRLKCLLDVIVGYCKWQGQKFDDCFITELHVYKKQDSQQKKAVLQFTPVTF